MPIYTPEQKQRLYASHGLSPEDYDIDEVTNEFVPRNAPTPDPSTAPETTTVLQQKPEVKNTPSMVESAARSAAESAIPTGASLAAGAGTLALSSWLGGPVTGVPITAAAILASISAGMGASKLQREVVPEDIQQKLFTRPEDIETNPGSTIAGGFVPSALAFNPVKGIQDLPKLASGVSKIPQVLGPVGRSALTTAEEQALLNAALNVAPQAGISTAEQMMSDQPLDFGRIAAESLPGVLFTRPTPLGKKLGFQDPISDAQLRALFPETGGQDVGTTTPPTEVPLTAEQLVMAGGARDPRSVEPSNIKLTPKALAQAERKQYALKGMKLRDEPTLMERAVERMEAEGGPAPREADTESQRELDFYKAQVEKRKQERIELEKQEAEQLRQENEAKARQLKMALGSKATPEAIIGRSVARPEVRPEVSPSAAQPDYTLKQRQKALDERIRPLTEAERIQEEYDLGRRESDEALLKEAQADVESLTPEQRTKLQRNLEQEAYRRGFRVERVPTIIGREGKSIAGSIDTKRRLIKVASGQETVPHEGAGHGFLNDLLNSSSPRDRLTAIEALNAFAGPKGKKFTNVDDWRKFARENPEEAFIAQNSIEETLAKDVALEGFRQSKVTAYGSKMERLRQWWKNTKSKWKKEFGLQTEEDMRRHLVARYRGDAPYGTRTELAPIKPTTPGKVVTTDEQTEQVQGQREEEGILNTLIERESQEGELPEIPISNKEYNAVYESWENHAALIGRAFYPTKDFDTQLRGGKNAIEEVARKGPLADKIISTLINRGVIKAAGSEDFRRKIVSLASTLREFNLGKRYSEEADLPSDKSDYQQYLDVQKKISERIKAGDYSSPEFQALWQENENIKNRHGGMPPKPDIESRESAESELKRRDDESLIDFAKRKRETLGDKRPQYEQSLNDLRKLERELEQIVNKDPSQLNRHRLTKVKQQIKYQLFNPRHTERESAESVMKGIEDQLGEASFRAAKEVEKEQKNLNEIAKRGLPADTAIRDMEDAADVAVKKSEELEAFTRPDVERQSDEAQLRDQQINSPEFKKWFGDSKVVDKDGKPLVVYHGTDSSTDFKSFRMVRGYTYGRGAYFTPEPSRAAEYATKRLSLAEPESSYKGNRIFPAYLSIKNPFVTSSDATLSDMGRKLYDKNRSEYDRLAKKVAEEEGYYSTEGISPVEVANMQLREEGYDGIIKEWRKNDPLEIVAFSPTQIKSAIGNQGTFDPSNPDIRYSEKPALVTKDYSENAPDYPSSYSFFGTTTARLDKVAEKVKAPIAKEVTYKMRQANTERDLLEGRVGNRLAVEMMQNTPEEVMRVRQYRHEIDNGFPAPFELSPSEQDLKKRLDKTYKEIGQLVIDSGLQVRTGDAFRQMKLKPEGYQENMPSTKVIDAWLENKPEAAEYDRLYIEHAKKKGETEAEARKVLEEYKQQVGNAGVTPDTKFGAIRRMEGIGLPWELVEQNGIVSARRYGKRVATDLAFFKYLQNDPRMLKALGLRDQFGNRWENSPLTKDTKLDDVQYIGSAPETVAAMRSIQGIDLPTSPGLQSFARVVGANIMQTGTAIRNIAALPTSIAPYYGVNPRSVLSAISKMHERTSRALENNAIKLSTKDFDAAGDFDGNPNRFIRWADKYVEFMRTLTGRNASDKFEGQFLYSLGEELATNWFPQAKNGDINARAMLNRFGTTIEGGVKKKFLDRNAEVTSDDIARVAKEFVDVARGSYSAGGLPSAAIEGPVAPFLALSRWSIERANNFYKDAILPIKDRGDYMPLLKTTLTGILTGAAIEEINEALNNKKGGDPTVSEVLKAGSKEDLVVKAIGLAQLGALGGIVSDTMKFGANVLQGKDATFASPLSFPAATVAEDVAKKTSFMVEAIRNGEDPFIVLAEYTKEILRAQSQNSRYIMNRIGDEAKRKEKFRDLRVFKELSGREVSSARGEANPFLNLRGKEFKKEEDLGKAIGTDLPAILDDIVSRAGGDFEKLKKELEGLKRNSYQIFPALSESPQTASEYYDYLVKTQGKEEADARLREFVEISQKNRIKSSMVPRL